MYKMLSVTLLLVTLLAVLTSSQSSPIVCGPSANITELFELVQNLSQTVDGLLAEEAQNHYATNVLWGIHSSFFIFFMQAGFGMLEAGIVAPTTVSSILTKKILGLAVSALSWWLVGYALAYGEQKEGGNPFIGTSNFASTMFNFEGKEIWVFHWAFASNTASIVSGALAHRLTLFGYLVVNLVIMSLIHPVAAYWIWSRSGWLSPYNPEKGPQFLDTIGYLDMAGGSAVHMIGGLAGFVGIVVSKINEGKNIENTENTTQPPENLTFAALGVFILFFGWFGFETGAVKDIIASPYAAQLCPFNMVIASASSALLCYIVESLKKLKRKWRDGVHSTEAQTEQLMLEVLNATLAGLVGITGSITYVEYWAAFIIGLFSYVVYWATKRLLILTRLADPLHSTAVHAACGIWGVLAAGLFSRRRYIEDVYFDSREHYDTNNYGLFMGGGWRQLVIQLIGTGVLISWTLLMCFPLFALLRFTKHLQFLRRSAPLHFSSRSHPSSRAETMVEYPGENRFEEAEGEKEMFIKNN